MRIAFIRVLLISWWVGWLVRSLGRSFARSRIHEEFMCLYGYRYIARMRASIYAWMHT